MTKILIVDDEEKMRHLLSMMLERNGFLVDKAIHGKHAMEQLGVNTYDLVISDIKMPQMDGKELIQQMRKENILTPVIFITAFATIDSAVEMMQQGAVDYVTKPFDDAKILFTIEKAMTLSRLIMENQEMKAVIAKADREHELIYSSNEMREVV
ncbi:MAG: response regulator, partial [Proteobacteria bacterium]|nr:response regulator [Desulfobacula sp.]MBU4129342.1 response regulator [Pseudomonadota bacterium]